MRLRRTSENSVNAKFVHITHNPVPDSTGPLHGWIHEVCVVGKGEGYAPLSACPLGRGAGALTRGTLAGWATLAAKFRGFESRQDLHTMHI